MELVYLWVEDYKNIKKQGFNFSPRFRCEYDDVKKELTIDENDDFIPDFFGENINVTAIVGKNGSGKSTIFEIIADWTSQTFLVYLENNKLYYYDLDINPKIIYSEKIIEKNHKKENFLCLNIYQRYEYVYFTKCNTVKLTQKESVKNYFKIYKILNKNLQDTKIPNFIYPEYIHITKNQKYIDDLKGQLSLKNRETSYFYERHIRDFSNFSEKQGYVLYLFNQMLDYGEKVDFDLWIDAFNLNIKCIHKIEKIIKSHNENFNFLIDEYNMLIDSELLSFHSQPNIHSSDLNKLIKYGLDKLIFKYIDFFDFNFSDKESMRSYENLSSGEKTLFSQFINLFTAIIESNQDIHILFLDEPDNTLHPQWQKEYINLFLEFLKANFKDKKFHCIITSHSPFLLSDIPKQNIIFLDKDNNGNCKVLSHDEVLSKKQTFGANIHTLLSDSFFMDDGLMGEFAKQKINEIIDFHKKVEEESKTDDSVQFYSENQKKFWQTQSIIGEEYLKQVLKNHLVEIEKILLGKDGAKKEEIRRVEAYLESLKK